jgi:hypothetical protein
VLASDPAQPLRFVGIPGRQRDCALIEPGSHRLQDKIVDRDAHLLCRLPQLIEQALG